MTERDSHGMSQAASPFTRTRVVIPWVITNLWDVTNSRRVCHTNRTLLLNPRAKPETFRRVGLLNPSAKTKERQK